jgi:hypothetical protein
MVRKLLPSAAAFKRRRRTVVVVSLPIVLAGAVIALAGGSSSGPSAQAAGAGFVRAANSGSTATAVSSTRTHAAATFGPNVINGIYQGESPAVSGLPILPVIPGPLHTRDNESLH